MAERLNLLDKWKILETIMRDLSLARNDLIVSQDLLEHYHDKVNGSRSSTRLIATRTGLARSRVSDCLTRLIDNGHFTIIAGQPRGSKATVYAPRKREGGPVHGASSAGHGPVHGSTKSPGGPVDGSTNGPVGGSTNAAIGPVHGSNKTLREVCLTPVKSKLPRLGPTTDAPRGQSPLGRAPDGAPGRAPGPARPLTDLEAFHAARKARALERLNAATAAVAVGGVWFSPRDLAAAHDWAFHGEEIANAEEIAEYAELDLCWARLVAALENGDPWATTWINSAVAADRDASAAERDDVQGEYDYEHWVEIERAFKAGEAPLPLGPTTDAARDQSPPVGAPGRAPPVKPTPSKTIERFNAAAAAGVAGGGRLSPRDLRDAHEYLKGDADAFAELDLCWTQMCAALRNGESWATAWIEAAAAAERDEQTSGNVDGDRLEAIYAAFRAGTAPSAA